jgi:hypothetical protein
MAKLNKHFTSNWKFQFSSNNRFSVGEPIARGCSSKEKMFHEHCETHEMDEVVEKFCYCSFNWCNASNHITVNYWMSIIHLINSCDFFQAISVPCLLVLIFIQLLFISDCLSWHLVGHLMTNERLSWHTGGHLLTSLPSLLTFSEIFTILLS